MTRAEAVAYIIGSWEKTAKENEDRAASWEKLAPGLADKELAGFLLKEAKFLREQAGRFRAMVKKYQEAGM